MADEKRRNQLSPTRFTGTEYAYNTWSVNAEQGTTRDDLKSPDFWSHIAHKLRAGDEIRVLAEDHTYLARFLVVASDRTWARVHEIEYVDLQTKVEEADVAVIVDDYEVKLRGPKRWSVIRKSDRAVLQENMHTQDDARQWLARYLENPTSAAA